MTYLERGITYPKFDGWCTADKSSAMIQSILGAKPDVFVEIGVFAGKSFIGAALALDINQRGIAYGIDPWSSEASAEGWPVGNANHTWWSQVDHEAIFQQCQDFIRLFGLEHRTKLLRMTSALALKEFTVIDMLHIDGNHNEQQALQDVVDYLPLVKPGGHVWFDDCDWETTRTAQIKLGECCSVVHSVGSCRLFQKRT